MDQDQPLDNVDFDHLNSRLKTNGVMEKISAQWLELLVNEEEVERV